MKIEKVLCGNEVEIEVKPVTVIFNAAQKDTHYLERISITPDMTLSYFSQLSTIDPYSSILFRMVVDDYHSPVTKKNIDGSPIAFKHLIGLFSLSFKLMIEGKKIVWKYPESFLHPKYQGNIADVMILMSNIDEFSSLIRFVQKGYFDDFILGQEDKGDKVYKRLCELKNNVC